MLSQSSISSQPAQFQNPSAAPIRSGLAVAATGLGKTVIMGAMAKHWPNGRVMMISHRFELNDQARKSIEKMCCEPVDFEQAEFKADQCSLMDRCRIVVASVQSLNSRPKFGYRFEKFDPSDFGLIMIDEAHRATSQSYRRVIKYFQQNQNCFLFGVTATPDRLDGVGLGHVFETTICNLDVKWGIDSGYLVPLKQKFVQINGLDFSSIQTTKNDVGESDLNMTQLGKLLEAEKFMHEMASPIIELAGEKSCIVFCASVSQGKRLAEIINRHRPGSAISIDGSMSPSNPERRELIQGFKDGEYQFFVNCGLATEGFDAPRAEFVAIARPTKSRALYTQMVGRVTRSLPSVIDGLETDDERHAAIANSEKPFATVLDFVGQAGRHSLICTGDILAGDEPKDIITFARGMVSRPEFDGDMVAAIQAAKKEAEAAEMARRQKLVARAEYETREVDPWSPLKLAPPRKFSKFNGDTPPTEKQIQMLVRNGVLKEEISQLNRQQASSVIGQIIERRKKGLCTFRQKRLLERNGINTSRMTFDQASEVISELKTNKRP